MTGPATPLARPPHGWWWAVAAGGAAGTALRALWLWRAPTALGLWPTTTFLENLLGAFALGAILGLLMRRRAPGWLGSPFFSTGLLGSFTTFSSLAWDVAATAASEPVLALTYGAASVALGVMAAAAGWRLGRGSEAGRT